MAEASAVRGGGMVALVTGASSGIGEATARLLARERRAAVVLVARREQRLRALADQLGNDSSWVAADLTAEDAPRRVSEHLRTRHGRLDLLVNNAGSAWRGSFGDSGWEGLGRHMELNFNAAARLTEALLPVLRASAPSAIVNVSSTAARVARARGGAYSASKAALALWSDALHLEEREHGVHVATVLPGFIATEGFPQRELPGVLVSTPEKGARAILDAGLSGRAERYVPRPYFLVGVIRAIAPGLVRRVMVGGAASRLTTTTEAKSPRAG